MKTTLDWRSVVRAFALAVTLAFLPILLGCGGATSQLGGGDDGPGDETTGVFDARQEAAPSMDGNRPEAAAPVDAAVMDARSDVADAATNVGDATRADTASPDAVANAADAAPDVRDARADVDETSAAEVGAPDVGADSVGPEAAADATEEIAATLDAGDGSDGFVPVPPDAPTGVMAIAGNALVNVSWTAPNDHGSVITQYTVTISSGLGTSTVTTSGATSVMVTGLVNGTAYTFTVTATNAGGTSAASTPPVMATPTAPPGVPSAPTITGAVAGDMSATVSWTAPADNGSPITSYTVMVMPAAGTVVISGTSATITNLVNGTTYTFTVTANNAVGAGPGATSSPVTPVGVPSVPAGVTATAGDASATVTWTASNPNGAPVTYTVTVVQGGGAVAITGTTATVTGLTNGVQYTFTVTATNVAGTSAPGTSNAVTPSGLPLAPTNVVATAGNASATVSWTAPANNGSAITGYTVTSSPGNVTATTTGATTVMVMPLTNCTSYTFTVKATNANGTGPASSPPSNAVTPMPAATVTYSVDIQGIFTNPNYTCTTCHGGAGGLTISYANIVNVPSGEVPTINYVTPGSPGISYLWCKVNPTDVDCTNAGTVITGVQMPRGLAPMSATDMTTLKTWIQECAPNN